MKTSFLPLMLAASILQACTSNSGQNAEVAQQAEQPQETTAVKVEIQQQDQGFRLIRGGKPYYINGAGGSRYLDELVAFGGNSIRTWSTRNAQEVLDEAHKRGLTVTMGLDVARERHGFDYNDEVAVAEQLERLRQDVQQFKDHPALLMWGIGNELNLHYTNPKVWDAVNGIARMIHQEDPNHPATTMLAGINKKEIDHILARVPELDLLAVNAYGGLPQVPRQVREYGWDKAYIVTEWGPTGHWEVGKTAWDVPIEETSSEKAAVYKSRYEAAMGQDKERNLGSYVFLWGQKQERTPTWYGLFTEAGETTEVADVMHYLWTSQWPQNRAPHLDSLRIDGKKAQDNLYLKPNASYPVNVYASDPEQNTLTYRWELLPESTDLKEGGDAESRPSPIEGRFSKASEGQVQLKAPAQAGAYRLFVYVSDGQNKVATANIPFFVRE
jgi:beta-galactosidase/beta-glucuronidase